MGAKAEPSIAGVFEISQLYNHLIGVSGDDPDLSEALSEPKRPRRRKKREKPGHVRVLDTLPIELIRPAPENDELYRPIRPDDPEIQALAESERRYGIQQPLGITQDFFLFDGHRRLAAAKIAGLTEVPVRIEQFQRKDDPDRFLRLLRECNRQREKTFAEKMREELVGLDSDATYESLIEHRTKRSRVNVPKLEIEGCKHRCEISKAKLPFLLAVKEILESRREFWPLSERAIHYALLNNPPLIHASKPKSKYKNDRSSYKSLCDLVTRARLTKVIPFSTVADETRPVKTWEVFQTPQLYFRKWGRSLFRDYWRDLMQSQANHIEIVCEKLTITPIVEPLAMKYCIPLTTGRGYSSIPPRYEMAERYRASGKGKLIVLLVSDFDPEGNDIAHSFARSMRDDFRMFTVHPIKVALTADQVKQYKLPPQMEAKKTSSRYAKFVEQYGRTVHELEALAPEQLQQILQEAIDSVIDIDAFNHELNMEREDSLELTARRRIVFEALGESDLDEDDDDD